MLAFLRQEMVCDAKKGFNGNMKTDFLASFANRAFLKRLQIIQLATDDAPTARFGGKLAQGEQNAAVLIDQEHANPHPGMATCRGAAIGDARHCFSTVHLTSEMCGAATRRDRRASGAASTIIISRWAGRINPSATATEVRESRGSQ